jgi:hypothetical protein
MIGVYMFVVGIALAKDIPAETPLDSVNRLQNFASAMERDAQSRSEHGKELAQDLHERGLDRQAKAVARSAAEINNEAAVRARQAQELLQEPAPGEIREAGRELSRGSRRFARAEATLDIYEAQLTALDNHGFSGKARRSIDLTVGGPTAGLQMENGVPSLDGSWASAGLALGISQGLGQGTAMASAGVVGGADGSLVFEPNISYLRPVLPGVLHGRLRAGPSAWVDVGLAQDWAWESSPATAAAGLAIRYRIPHTMLDLAVVIGAQAEPTNLLGALKPVFRIYPTATFGCSPRVAMYEKAARRARRVAKNADELEEL